MQKIKGKRVTDSQVEVFDILATYGPLPDHALVPLAQHVAKSHQSSSGIRTRRSELQGLGLVKDTGTTIQTASGREAAVFRAK